MKYKTVKVYTYGNGDAFYGPDGIEDIHIALNLLKMEIPKSRVARMVGVSRMTLDRWIANKWRFKYMLVGLRRIKCRDR